MALFITFEGPDGSGKTTILKMIEKELKNRFQIYTTREPGGTKVSEKIRDLLLDPSLEMGAKTEALLYGASRAEHVEKVILPKLKSGIHVLCDRYVLSSLAYQGAGRELGIKKIKELNDFATGELEPDLSLFFDVDPLTVLERKNDDRDRLELEADEFHQKVYAGYQEIMERYKDHGNFKIIDASQSIEKVFSQSLGIIEKYMEEEE